MDVKIGTHLRWVDPSMITTLLTLGQVYRVTDVKVIGTKTLVGFKHGEPPQYPVCYFEECPRINKFEWLVAEIWESGDYSTANALASWVRANRRHHFIQLVGGLWRPQDLDLPLKWDARLAMWTAPYGVQVYAGDAFSYRSAASAEADRRNQKLLSGQRHWYLKKYTLCMLCEGAGTLTLNGHTVACPKVLVSGEVVHHTKWLAHELVLSQKGGRWVNSSEDVNVAESDAFETWAEARAACALRNQELGLGPESESD